ncbi:MAG: radical SAM protein [Treponema sp.]|jgi:hypothetical protein|nr:radical SAM protein [Treponema sp.]
MGGPIILATINAKWIHPSLALRLLKANLGDYEDRCEILEFALRQPLAEKTGPILASRPLILGLSVSIWNHSATLELLKALDEEWKAGLRPVLVLGGPEVSYLPEDAEIFRYADYVIRGEGEFAFYKLCSDLLAKPDLLSPSGNGGFRNTVRPPAGLPAQFIDAPGADLSLVRSAYHLYTAEDLTRKLVYVEASRGCPFSCEFCLSPAWRSPLGKGQGPGFDGLPEPPRRVREFPLEAFLGEMEDLIRRGARTFKFLDRTFNYDSRRARTIMEFFLRRIGERTGEPPFCVHFEFFPSPIPPELRETLRRFPPGSLRLELGIQTFNPRTARLIKRGGNTAEALETLEFLVRETAAIIHADLIAGLPGEDMGSFGAGFDRLWKALSAGMKAEPRDGEAGHGRVEIQLGILKLLPGAAISRHTEACRMRYSPAPPYQVIGTAAMPAADLDRVKNFARFWELIVNRGNFDGLAARFFPPGELVFDCFMNLSDRLLERFGRNWGIDRRELREALLDSPAGTCVR